jgi:hypothetical protein
MTGDRSITNGRAADPEAGQVTAGEKREYEGGSSSSDEACKDGGKVEDTKTEARKFAIPKSLAWIPANANWSKMKPVIRSALSAWLSLVLLLIGPVQQTMGQV